MNSLHLLLRGGWSRALVVLATALSLVAGLMVATPSVAYAAVNPGITISDLTLKRSDYNGVVSGDGTQTISMDSAARLDFTWDTGGTRISAGDSFEVEAPMELESWRAYSGKPLLADHDNGQVEVGTCEIDNRKLVCTFSEKVDELKAQGYNGLQGEGWAVYRVLQSTTNPTVDFTLNGKATPVNLPNGRIDPRQGDDYRNHRFTKVAELLGPGKKRIGWEINFNSNYMQKMLKDHPQALTLDGKTPQTLTFEDNLGAGHSFSENSGVFYFMVRNSKDNPQSKGEVVAFVNGSQDKVVKTYGDFTIAFDRKSDRNGVFTITGPFANETNYKIVYTTVPDGGEVKPDYKYTNEANIAGHDQVAQFSRHYTQTYDVTATLKPGFGSFDLTKIVKDKQGKVPADAEYKVNISYILPNGSKASDHAAWEPVGTLNADKTGGTATVVLKANEIKRFEGMFPTGTQIKLSEDKASLPTGFEWREPKFAPADSFVVEELKRTEIELTNEVAKIEIKPLPPTTTSTSSTPKPEPSTSSSKPAPATSSSSKVTTEPSPAASSTSDVPAVGSSASPWWLALFAIIPAVAFLVPLLGNILRPAPAPKPAEPTKGISKPVGKGL